MIRRLVLALGVLLGLAGGARANCVLPFTLLNGTLADATQVMGNFNALNTCVNSLVTSQIAHTVLIGPTSGVPAAPTFRLLAGTDLPLPTSTTLGGVESIAVSSHKWINTISTAGAPSLTQPGVEDLSDPPMVMASFYGVTAGNSAATNTTDLIAAATAAYNLGLPLNICISGAASVVIPTNGSAFYGGMRIIPCSATQYKMGAAGAAFYTLPDPSHTVVCPASVCSKPSVPLTIEAGLNIDMNNQDGTGLLIEDFDNSRITQPLITNWGTGSWTHSDGVNLTGSYPDAAMTVKGVNASGGGAFYNRLIQPFFTTANCAIVGGDGLLLTTTAASGSSGKRPNVTKVEGGQICGATNGVLIQAGGDFHLEGTDLSANTYAAVVGDPSGYNTTIPRAIFDSPYMESNATNPEYIGVWFTSVAQNGRLNGTASVTAIAPCVDDSTNPILTQTGTTHTSTSITGLPANGSTFLTTRAVGQLVSGAGIPAGAVVTAVNTSTTVTISIAATASASVTLTFTDPRTFSNYCGTTKPSGTPFTPTLVTAPGAGVYVPPSREAGWFDITLAAAGGTGGGCVASDATHNCVGGGGGGGEVAKLVCQDPRQMNMRGATYVIGDTGAAGTGAGGAGNNSTFTGAIPPFSAGTWTLPDWVALTPYVVTSTATFTSFVLPTVGNAGAFEFAAIGAGVSDVAHPVWPQTPGNTVADGTVLWENMGHAVWTAGGTVVVDTSLPYPLGTLIGPATAQNAGSYFYMAVQPGNSGNSGHPTWPQQFLSVVSDSTVIWQNVAQSLYLQVGGGGGGQTGGFAAGSIELTPKGIAGANSFSGCTVESDMIGIPGTGAYFDFSRGYGHSGTGGSTVLGRGGLGQPVINSSTQVVGNPGIGPGAAGGGAISAINNAGSTEVGGLGVAGQLYVAPFSGASP